MKFIATAKKVGTTTFWQFVKFFAPAITLLVLNHIASTKIERIVTVSIGKRIYLLLFGWFGTFFHESAHAIACLIFRHKIKEIKFFSFDPEVDTLGYVNHSYNPKSFYQELGNFFIGIAPVISGIFLIYISMFIFLDINVANSTHIFTDITMIIEHSFSFDAIGKVITDFKDFFALIYSKRQLGIPFYIFLYITFSISSGMNLSGTDIKSAWVGGALLLILMFIVNIATYISFKDAAFIYTYLTPYMVTFCTVMMYVLLVNIALIIILFPIGVLAEIFKKKKRKE
jgi:hypothetical protein